MRVHLHVMVRLILPASVDTYDKENDHGHGHGRHKEVIAYKGVLA